MTKESFELVNQATGELLQLPEIMLPAQEGLLIPEQPIDLRGIGKGADGHFSIGGQTNEGSSVEFHLFNYRMIEGIRPSAKYREPANFAQLIGLAKIAGKKALTCLTLGSSSAQSTKDIIPLLALKGGGLANILLINMEKTTNKHGDEFCVARFGIKPATPDEIESVRECLTIAPDAFNRFRELQNIDDNE